MIAFIVAYCVLQLLMILAGVLVYREECQPPKEGEHRP